MNQKMQELISDSQFVIIGIGPEFGYQMDRQEILKKLNMNMDDFSDYMWILDYLVAEEQKRADVSKYVSAYNHLYEMVKDKNYFIVTLNTDDIIYESMFSREKITAPCGSIGRLQCSCGCEGSIQNAEEIVNSIAHQVWSEKRHLSEIERPVCQTCGKPLIFHTVEQEGYMEAGYLKSWEKYRMWLTGTLNRKLCLLELGTDFKFPSVVRWAFEKVAFLNEKAVLMRVCEKYPQLTEELQGKAISIKQNPLDYLRGTV